MGFLIHTSNVISLILLNSSRQCLQRDKKNKLTEEGHFTLLCSLPRWQEEEPRYIPKHGNTSARRREKDSPTGHIGWCSDKAWYEDKKLRRGWRGQVESRVEKWAKGNRERRPGGGLDTEGESRWRDRARPRGFGFCTWLLLHWLLKNDGSWFSIRQGEEFLYVTVTKKFHSRSIRIDNEKPTRRNKSLITWSTQLTCSLNLELKIKVLVLFLSYYLGTCSP